MFLFKKVTNDDSESFSVNKRSNVDNARKHSWLVNVYIVRNLGTTSISCHQKFHDEEANDLSFTYTMSTVQVLVTILCAKTCSYSNKSGHNVYSCKKMRH